MDSGAQRTFITKSLAKQLNLKPEGFQVLKLLTFSTGDTKATHS